MEKTISDLRKQLQQILLNKTNSNLDPEENNTNTESTLCENFDPMTDDYSSKDNTFTPGQSGDIGCFLDYKKPAEGKVKNLVKLYVSNIPEKLTEIGLRNIFQIYGDVLEYRIRRTDDGYRFGFISYSHLDSAAAAIHGLNLRKPFNFKVRYAQDNKTKTEEVEEAAVEDISIPVIPTYEKPKFPSNPSITIQRFLESDFYRNAKNPEQAHDRFIHKIKNEPMKRSKRYLDNRQKLSELSDEEISRIFEVNGEKKYNLCDYCLNPASYVCSNGNTYFCSLYCQENKLKNCT